MNLMYEASSATVELDAGVSFTLKWDYGSDLRSSTIWGYTGGTGFVLENDTLYLYQSSGSSTEIIASQSGITDLLNDSFSNEYGIDTDLNLIVQNGRMNRGYIEELSRQLSDVNPSGNASDTFGFDPGSIDAERATEIINDFMTKEVDDQAVQDRFLKNTETRDNGGETIYEGSFDLVAFFTALSDYAAERGRDSSYANAADAIEDACSQVYVLDDYLSSLDFSISVRGNMLSGVEVDLGMQGTALSVQLEISDVNATDLASDSRLQDILASPDSSSGGFSNPFGFI